MCLRFYLSVGLDLTPQGLLLPESQNYLCPAAPEISPFAATGMHQLSSSYLTVILQILKHFGKVFANLLDNISLGTSNIEITIQI